MDVSFDIGGARTVLQDEFIPARNGHLAPVLDAQMAKATALRQDIKLALSIRCNRIVIQSDCLDVMTTMYDGGQS